MNFYTILQTYSFYMIKASYCKNIVAGSIVIYYKSER